MRILRKLFVFLSAATLGTLLFLLVASISFVLRFGTGDRIKVWLSESGAYDHFTQAIIEQSIKANQGKEGAIPIDDPQLQAKAQEAFRPQLIGTSAEAIIDGTYAWLHGDTNTPEFSVDFTAAKNEFGELVGKYAVSTYEDLPECTRNEVPESVNPFSDTCRIPGLSSEIIRQQVTKEISNSQDLLKDTKFTADSFRSQKDVSKTVFDEFSAAPRIFQLLLFTPYLFGILTIVSVLIIVFGDDNRRRGLRRVAVSFLTTGVIVAVASAGSPYLLEQFDTRVNGLTGDGGAIATKVVNPIISAANKDTVIIGVLLGTLYIVIGVGLFIYLFATRHRYTRKSPSASKIPHSRKHLREQDAVHTPVPPTSRAQQPAPAMRDASIPKPATAPPLPRHHSASVAPDSLPIQTSEGRHVPVQHRRMHHRRKLIQ